MTAVERTPEGMTYRKVRMSPELMKEWASRNEDCNRLTWNWGEPDADGFYTPIVEVRYDDNPLAALVEEAKAREREIERLENEALADRMGWSTICVKCGQRYELQGGDAEVLAHVWDCEEHPLKLLVDALEEKCLDLDHEAQELLRNDDDGGDLGHASALHKSIGAVREVVADVKRATARSEEANDGAG